MLLNLSFECCCCRYRALLLGDAAVERAGGKSWGAAANGTAGGSSDDEQQQLSGEDLLGSGSSSDEEQQQQGSRKVRKQGKGESLEMTVTFTPGLEKLGQRLRDKKQQEAAAKGDSVWEAYLRWGRWLGYPGGWGVVLLVALWVWLPGKHSCSAAAAKAR
jgi:hypothetical protein